MAADTTGVLIHLEPSQAASKALLEASGGKEPLENQHITLAYLGTLGEEVPDDEATRDRIMNTVGYVAARYAALAGEANGWGTFHNDDGSVLVALWNIPGINGLRQALVDELRAVGIPVKPNYSYTPHQTMGYYDESQAVPTPGRMDSPVKEDFMVLHWNWGGEQQDPVALSGIRREAKDGKDYTRGGNADNPGQFSKQDRGHRKKDKDTSTERSKGEGGSGGGSSAPSDDKAPGKSQGEDQEQPQEAQETPQEPEGQQGAPEAQEAPSDPVEGYTGVAYDPTATFFTEEQRIAHGDAYGHFLPAGRYAEGDPRNEPEFERLMAEKTALTEKYVGVTKAEIDAGATEGGPTEMLYDHLGPEGAGYDGLWKPERIKVHQEILARLSETYANYPRGGKAIVMAGPPGAGKSTFLANYGAAEFGIEVKGKDEPKEDPPSKNFVTINPDDFKELLPIDASRYPGLEPNELAPMLHEESSMLAELATKHFMSQGYNVIIDITLGKESSATRKYYTPYADSYDYQVALVDGTMNNSLNNAGLRWKKPDKETGVRTYGGRFLPMGLIEHNAPSEGSPYRSKNAEEFTKFIGHDGVSRAVVYDPDTASIAEAKEGSGVLDWLGAKSITEESEDEGLAAAARLVRRALSSILVVEGRASRKKPAMRKSANYQVPPEGTEITEKIVSYKEGEIQFTELVDWLTNHTYSPGAVIGAKPGSPEWYEEVENRTTTPGTFAEVVDSVGYGLLTWEEYTQISEALIQKLGA